MIRAIIYSEIDWDTSDPADEDMTEAEVVESHYSMPDTVVLIIKHGYPLPEEDQLADLLSDETGFCVNGFSVKVINEVYIV